MMVVSKRKSDAINALSDGFFDADDNDAYTELIEKYLGESGDEMETNTDNEEGTTVCNLSFVAQC